MPISHIRVMFFRVPAFKVFRASHRPLKWWQPVDSRLSVRSLMAAVPCGHGTDCQKRTEDSHEYTHHRVRDLKLPIGTTEIAPSSFTFRLLKLLCKALLNDFNDNSVSAITRPVLYEHHVCVLLLLRECPAYQPRAEHVGIVGIQPEGDGNDDFKRVHVCIQPVFKRHIATHLVVVQHIRLADGFNGGIHRRNARMEQSGDFCGGHPYLVTGYVYRLVFYNDDTPFHGFSFFR